MRFEWDPEKDRSNARKHQGINFSTAARVFGDPHLLLQEDRVVEGERRWHAIGIALNALLVVVHVYREDDKNDEEIIRIISARQANQRERRIYLEQTPY